MNSLKPEYRHYLDGLTAMRCLACKRESFWTQMALALKKRVCFWCKGEDLERVP